MTTVIERKQTVEPKWNATKIQEQTALTIARQFIAIHSVLGQHAPAAIKDFDQAMLNYKVDYYKSVGVKTPLDLVNAMAEFEANIFGSKIEIVGDEKKASIIYQTCAIWESMKKIQTMTPDQEEKMGAQHETCVKNLAKELGFTAELKIEEPIVTVTFSK